MVQCTLLFVFGLGSTHRTVGKKLDEIRAHLQQIGGHPNVHVEAYFSDGVVSQLWQTGLIVALGRSISEGNDKRRRMVQGVADRVQQLTQDEDHHVTVIGHSLGGYYVSAAVKELWSRASAEVRWPNIRAYTLGTIGIHVLPTDRPIPVMHFIFANDVVGVSRLLNARRRGVRVPSLRTFKQQPFVVDAERQLVWLRPLKGVSDVHSAYLSRLVFPGLLRGRGNSPGNGNSGGSVNMDKLLHSVLRDKHPADTSVASMMGPSVPCLRRSATMSI